MEIDFGEVSCGNDATDFIVYADGQPYTFTIPNELIYPYLDEGDKIDCLQFVLESQEIFEQLAEDVISKGVGVGSGPIKIDETLLTTYFV
jgi:hypothetical protein